MRDQQEKNSGRDKKLRDQLRTPLVDMISSHFHVGTIACLVWCSEKPRWLAWTLFPQVSLFAKAGSRSWPHFRPLHPLCSTSHIPTDFLLERIAVSLVLAVAAIVNVGSPYVYYDLAQLSCGFSESHCGIIDNLRATISQ
jgi:hypothetical protein